MLKAIEVENFKAFSDPQRIRLAPITLIYGANSSGKTSLIQSLLLLRQTLDNEDDPTVLLAPKGSYIDLGGFREFVHGHELGRDFSIRLEVDAADQAVARSTVALSRYRQYEQALRDQGPVALKITYGYNADRRLVELKALSIYLGATKKPLVRFVPVPARADDSEAAQGFVQVGHRRGETMRIGEVDWRHPYWASIFGREGKRDGRAMREFLDFLLTLQADAVTPSSGQKAASSAIANYQTFVSRATRNRVAHGRPDLLSLARESSSEDLRRLRERYGRYTLRKAIEDYRDENKGVTVGLRNFLPFDMFRREETIRSVATGSSERLFDLAGLAGYVGVLVRNALERLTYLGPLREYPERHYIFSGTRSSQVGKSGKLLPDVLYTNRTLVDQLNAELELFGVGYELRVSAVVEDDPALEDVFAMRLVDRASGVNVSIRDVGFGISQVLPVIVQSMLSRRSLVAVEQPELHLHPRLQSELAELFVRCIEAPRSNRFLIETHSEHMMLRLQRLIRDGRLDHRKVSVIYVDRSESGTRAVPLRLDAEGAFIDPWPGGFFEEGFREIFG